MTSLQSFWLLSQLRFGLDVINGYVVRDRRAGGNRIEKRRLDGSMLFCSTDGGMSGSRSAAQCRAWWGVIDDATSKLMDGAHFLEQETKPMRSRKRGAVHRQLTVGGQCVRNG